MVKKIDKKLQGKRNREAGARFERKTRLDLEKKGWIVDRWNNNVKFFDNPKWFPEKDDDEYWKKQEELSKKPTCKKCHTFPCLCNLGPRILGKLVPAKSTIFRSNTHGFPDFVAFKKSQKLAENSLGESIKVSVVQGIECKSNGYLTKEEKEKALWLLKNNVFSKILVAKKGKKRGEIKYNEFI